MDNRKRKIVTYFSIGLFLLLYLILFFPESKEAFTFQNVGIGVIKSLGIVLSIALGLWLTFYLDKRWRKE